MMESKEDRLNFIDSALRLTKLEKQQFFEIDRAIEEEKRTLARNWKQSDSPAIPQTNSFAAKRWHRKKTFRYDFYNELRDGR